MADTERMHLQSTTVAWPLFVQTTVLSHSLDIVDVCVCLIRQSLTCSDWRCIITDRLAMLS